MLVKGTIVIQSEQFDGKEVVLRQGDYTVMVSAESQKREYERKNNKEGKGET